MSSLCVAELGDYRVNVVKVKPPNFTYSTTAVHKSTLTRVAFVRGVGSSTTFLFFALLSVTVTSGTQIQKSFIYKVLFIVAPHYYFSPFENGLIFNKLELKVGNICIIRILSAHGSFVRFKTVTSYATYHIDFWLFSITLANEQDVHQCSQGKQAEICDDNQCQSAKSIERHQR